MPVTVSPNLFRVKIHYLDPLGNSVFSQTTIESWFESPELDIGDMLRHGFVGKIEGSWTGIPAWRILKVEIE